jgi:hypothetical protein
MPIIKHQGTDTDFFQERIADGMPAGLTQGQIDIRLDVGAADINNGIFFDISKVAAPGTRATAPRSRGYTLKLLDSGEYQYTIRLSISSPRFTYGSATSGI